MFSSKFLFIEHMHIFFERKKHGKMSQVPKLCPDSLKLNLCLEDLR